MVLNGRTVYRLVIKRIGVVGYKRQMIEYRIHAFILIRFSIVRPFTRPEFARILDNRNLLV